MNSPARAPSRPAGSRIGRFSLLAAIIFALLSSLVPALRIDAEPQQVVLGFSLDRSAVPEWVTSRALTLRIDAPGAEQAWVFADELPAPFFHDRADGSLLVTTEASEIVVALAGEALDPEQVGSYAVTTLRDDKAWAYSLTFDDGRYTVYQYALPELNHYGYQAAVAVIGEQMDTPHDPTVTLYCNAELVLELMDSGWGVFNHSYRHADDPASITYANVLNGQIAIRDHLEGHEAIVFTVPYTTDAWTPIIDSNQESLGLRLMQLESDGQDGLPTAMHLVDDPIILRENAAYHLGRRDITQWSSAGYNYFGEAHGMAPQHVWVSLHGHDPSTHPDHLAERCAIAESLSYLYHTYGPAGSDEVWMAPADQVFQYLVTRSYTVVQQNLAPSIPGGMPDDPWRADEWVLYSPEMPNVLAWSDTYIDQYAPNDTHEHLGTLNLRAGAQRASLLIKMNLQPPDPDAMVLEARLSLYATYPGNNNAVDMTIHALNRDWDPKEATWIEAIAGDAWDQAGAGAATDRFPDPLDTTPSGSCSQNTRWYTFDVTQQVKSWLLQPDENEGLLLESLTSQGREIRFAGARYGNTGLRPKLYVRYGWPMPALPTPTATLTPEPTITPSPTPPGTKIFLPLLCRP